MRVAVLADIHGNLPALESVLAEAQTLAVDRFVLLGDIASGPMPGATLDLLASLGERAVWVHGNGERELVAGFDGLPLPPGPVAEGVAKCVPLLAKRHRDLMDGLPMTVTLDVQGLGAVLFCHATPRRDDEFILVDSPMGRWAEVLRGVEEKTVVLGHTHMPFDRLADGVRVINPGSVGMAYGPPGACWAILGPGVELRRTAYDVRAAAERIGAGGYPGAGEWAAEYVVHTYGDAEALEEFTKIAEA